MAVAAARITAFLKSVADAGADLLEKIAYGTPGSSVVYPEATPDNQATTGAQATGQIYPGVVIPKLLAQVGAEMDKAACIWASIQTNGTGVAPTVTAAHPNVTSAVKDETLGVQSLRLVLAVPFANACYFNIMWLVQGPLAIPENNNVDVSFFTYCFVDAGSVLLDINNRTVMAFACGQV